MEGGERWVRKMEGRWRVGRNLLEEGTRKGNRRANKKTEGYKRMCGQHDGEKVKKIKNSRDF